MNATATEAVVEGLLSLGIVLWLLYVVYAVIIPLVAIALLLVLVYIVWACGWCKEPKKEE